MSDELTLSDVMARLDKQAKAIKDLRARVRTLEAGELRPVATGEAVPAGMLPLPDTCLMCKQPKAPNRRTLMTCKPCAKERVEAISEGGARREAVIPGTCGTCGTNTGRSVQLVCATCRPAVKAWQTAVKAGRA